jgi:hypothetical protein
MESLAMSSQASYPGADEKLHLACNAVNEGAEGIWKVQGHSKVQSSK